MSMDNVGLKYMLFGGLELQGLFDIFPLVWMEVILGRVQQPITNFTRPRDDLMVHGVNNP